MLKISIVMPAYNEEKAIATLVNGVHNALGKNYSRNEYEIIVVDDGSTDRTAQEAQNSDARVIRHPYNIGNGSAVKTGLRKAKGEIVILMDSDGQHDPAYIPELIK